MFSINYICLGLFPKVLSPQCHKSVARNFLLAKIQKQTKILSTHFKLYTSIFITFNLVYSCLAK